MKSIFKWCLSILILSVSIFTFFQVHADNNLKELLSLEVNALGQNENQHYHYTHLQGKPVECKLYVYINIATGSQVTLDGPNSDLDINGSWTYQTKKGIKDLCPQNGDGCNPFSCQEITYIP